MSKEPTKPLRIPESLIVAINKGKRVRALYDDLPPEAQAELARLAGLSLGKRNGRAAGKARAGAAKVLEKATRQGPGPVLDAWFKAIVLPGWAAWQFPEEPWKTALFYRLLRVLHEDLFLPADILQLADDVVAGARERLGEAAEGTWHRWLTLVTGVDALRHVGLEASAAIDVLRQPLRVDDVQFDDEQTTIVAWSRLVAHSERLVAARQQTIRDARDRLAGRGADLVPLLRAAEEADVRLPDLPEEGTDAEKMLAIAAKDPGWFEELEKGIRPALEALSTDRERLRAQALVTLPQRLEPRPPARDMEFFKAQAEPLRQQLEAGGAIDFSDSPVLVILGHLFLDEMPMEDADYGQIEETMTGRFCRLIRERGFLLRPAEPRQPGREDASAQEPHDVDPENGAVQGHESLAPSFDARDGRAKDEGLKEEVPGKAGATRDGAVLVEARPASSQVAIHEDGDREHPSSEEDDHREPNPEGREADSQEGADMPRNNASEEPPSGQAETGEAVEPAAPHSGNAAQDAFSSEETGTNERAPGDRPVAGSRHEPVQGHSPSLAPDPGPAPGESGSEVGARVVPTSREDGTASSDQPEVDPVVRDHLEALARKGEVGEMARMLEMRRDEPSAPWTACLLAGLLVNADLDSNLDLAYWLAVAAGPASPLSPWVAEVLRLGVQYQPGFHRSTERLRELFAAPPHELDEMSRPEALLLAAALVRPILMAPMQTHAIYQLVPLRAPLSFLPDFHEFSERLVAFAKQGVPLASDLMRHLTTHAEWEEERQALEDETEDWLQTASKRKIKYQDATRVWVYWTENKGDLRGLVEKARHAEKAAERSALRKELADWTVEKTFREKLDRTTEHFRQNRKSKAIRHGAFDAIYRLAQDAADLAARWLDLHETRPEQGGSGLAHGRRVLEGLEKPARRIVDQLSQLAETGSLLEFAGVTRLARALEEIVHRFDEAVTPRRSTDPLQNSGWACAEKCGIGSTGPWTWTSATGCSHTPLRITNMPARGVAGCEAAARLISWWKPSDTGLRGSRTCAWKHSRPCWRSWWDSVSSGVRRARATG